MKGLKQMIMVGGGLSFPLRAHSDDQCMFWQECELCISNLSRLLYSGPGCLKREGEDPHMGMAVITVFSWFLHEPCTFWEAMLSVGETEARSGQLLPSPPMASTC